VIQVRGLRKTFKVPEKVETQTWGQKVGQLFHRSWKEVEVLKGLDFTIDKGEFIGYIGANGAGKSTTIKVLTGILKHDGGHVECAGFDPYRQRYDYSYNIGVVFGQKSILEYEVPVRASFELYRHIYEMEENLFHQRIGFFNEILDLDELLHIPVRKLSFGQRMRCEVAASLLHKPSIVFLDEPTIGLDATAKKEIRNFLKTVNEEDQTTIILTTHDMKDIESLCKRVLMIDRGQMIYDGSLERLRSNHLREKILSFQIRTITDRSTFGTLKARANSTSSSDAGEHWVLDTEAIDIPSFIQSLLSCTECDDLNMHEPELEEVVSHIYGQGHAKPSEEKL